jgi:hypothetical protein
MLLPKKLQGVKKILFVGIAFILIGVIGYLIYANFSDSGIKIVKSFGENKVEALVVSKINTEFKSDFLNKSPYINLKSGAKLPVLVEKTGRNNPFKVIPFSLLNN